MAGVLAAVDVAVEWGGARGALNAADPVGLRDREQFAAGLAIEKTVLVQQELLLRLAIRQQLLLDSGAVQVAEELVSAFLQRLQLLVGDTLGDLRHDIGVEVGQTDLARVDDLVEPLTEKLAPYALVDPRYLEKVRRHQLVEAVVLREHLEAFAEDGCDLAVSQLTVLFPVFLTAKVPVVLRAELDELEDPQKSVCVAVHGDLDALGVLDVLHDVREVRDGLLVLLEPGALEEHVLQLVLLALLQLYLHVGEVEIGRLVLRAGHGRLAGLGCLIGQLGEWLLQQASAGGR